MISHVVPDNILRHIGDITVSFALLELEMQSHIWMIIAEPQRIGQIITAEISFKNLRALMISLYKEKYGEGDNFNKLKKLMGRAENLEGKRNQITHSMWGSHMDQNTVRRFKSTAKESKGFQFQFEAMKEEDFIEIATGLRQLAADLQSFWTSIYIQSSSSNELNPDQKQE